MATNIIDLAFDNGIPKGSKLEATIGEVIAITDEIAGTDESHDAKLTAVIDGGYEVVPSDVCHGPALDLVVQRADGSRQTALRFKFYDVAVVRKLVEMLTRYAERGGEYWAAVPEDPQVPPSTSGKTNRVADLISW